MTSARALACAANLCLGTLFAPQCILNMMSWSWHGHHTHGVAANAKQCIHWAKRKSRVSNR